MTKFRLVVSALSLSLLVILSACGTDTEEKKTDLKVCPQCNMQLSKSKIYTAMIENSGTITYFDDIGCMILYAHKNKLDLKTIKSSVYAKDVKKYIDTKDAFYKIDEKTPMMYGFSAYEKEKKKTINIDEVEIRMLRGEHMANPKIRKHILGY